MPIPPDTKNWTWVLERPCPDCGFDAAALDRSQVGVHVRANAAAWQEVLARPHVDIRPDDQTWSPLEYAAHVHDVLRIFDERLRLMIEQDNPLFAHWDQDRTAVEKDYASMDPTVVAAEVLGAATLIAARFESVGDDQWDRPGHRSDGATFTIDTFARYLLHDPVHHLCDVGAPGV